MSVMRKFSIRSTSLPMSWELYIQLFDTPCDRTVAGTAYWVHLLGNYIFEILFVGKLKKVSSLIFLHILKTFDIFLFADLGSVLFLYTRWLSGPLVPWDPLQATGWGRPRTTPAGSRAASPTGSLSYCASPSSLRPPSQRVSKPAPSPAKRRCTRGRIRMQCCDPHKDLMVTLKGTLSQVEGGGVVDLYNP